MVKFKSRLYLLCLLFLLFFMQACSHWHLRTKPLTSPAFQEISIVSNEPYSNLTKAVQTALKQAGYKITSSSTTQLQLYNEKLTNTPYTYNDDGILKENYLVYSLTFSISNTKTHINFPKQTLTKNTFSYYNPSTLLSSNNSNEILINELRDQCITEMLYKLAFMPLPSKKI